MPFTVRLVVASVFLWAAGVQAVYANPQPPEPVRVEIDLSKAFATASPWHFSATQDAAVFEPVDPDLIGLIQPDYKGAYVPGLVHLCLQSGPAAPCDPLVAMPQAPARVPPDLWAPHYLKRAEIVLAGGEREAPLFLLQAASRHSYGDGNQAVFTQLLAYNRVKARFEQVYAHVTGRNNNEEDRFIPSGPLQGSVISVEPTSNAPFVYWVTVSRPTSDSMYNPVLRFRSATRYRDGNTLGVIDSEMPNIERHLGLWHPGMPLPLPVSAGRSCPNPHLVREALWCT